MDRSLHSQASDSSEAEVASDLVEPTSDLGEPTSDCVDSSTPNIVVPAAPEDSPKRLSDFLVGLLRKWPALDVTIKHGQWTLLRFSRIKEAEARSKEAEVKLKEAEVKLKEAEVKLKEAEAKLKALEVEEKSGELKLKKKQQEATYNILNEAISNMLGEEIEEISNMLSEAISNMKVHFSPDGDNLNIFVGNTPPPLPASKDVINR